MLRDNAIQEYADIHKYDPIIKKIKHNSQYFILDKISYCEPDTLSSEDIRCCILYGLIHIIVRCIYII